MSTKMLEKQHITENVADIGCYSLDGSISDAIQLLKNMAERYGEDAYLDYGQHYKYDESYSYAVKVSRLETDKEFAARCAGIESVRKVQHQEDMKRLEELAKRLNVQIVPAANKDES